MKNSLFALLAAAFFVGCNSNQPKENTASNTTVEAVKNTPAPTPTPTPAVVAAPSTTELLQGKWESLDDKKSAIEFKDGFKIDYYNQKEVSKAAFSLDKTCAEAPAGAEKAEGYLVSDGMCYSIEVLDKASLELTYMGRGNTLRYKKI